MVPRDRLVNAALTVSSREVMTPAREWPAPAHERMTIQAGDMRAAYRAPDYRAPAKASDRSDSQHHADHGETVTR
jgi:hypothetical protein